MPERRRLLFSCESTQFVNSVDSENHFPEPETLPCRNSLCRAEKLTGDSHSRIFLHFSSWASSRTTFTSSLSLRFSYILCTFKAKLKVVLYRSIFSSHFLFSFSSKG